MNKMILISYLLHASKNLLSKKKDKSNLIDTTFSIYVIKDH